MIRMFTKPYVISLLLVVAVLVGPGTAAAFQEDGCASAECSNCHSLTKGEAEKLLEGVVKDVLTVEFSEVRGLWVVDVEGPGGQRVPIYIDFSKQYAFSGNIVKLATRESLTQRRMIELNRTDFSKIPLEDTIVIGDPAAENKVVVFTDPDCPHCRKLHPILREAVVTRNDVAFYVKAFSINPKSYDKAKALACAKSLTLLDDAMAGKEIGTPQGCESTRLDANLALGRALGVRSTPTLVFPDGRVIPGAKSAEQIFQLLDTAGGKQAADGKNPG